MTSSLTFRCPAELFGWLPVPTPAVQGLPQWIRDMPREAFSATVSGEDDTVKRCPPFLDAMTGGFLMLLMCDVRVEDGEFSWDADIPAGGSLGYPRSPIGFHDPGQVVGTPLAEDDRYLIKFHNLWAVEAPAGYALLFTHPVNRFDLPFTTLTGLVDCDRYRDVWIHFPARWNDAGFSGVLPRGTPVAQCFPVRRDSWAMQALAFDAAQTQRAHDSLTDTAREKGVYRRRFRA
jgi:hypothetical protein